MPGPWRDSAAAPVRGSCPFMSRVHLSNQKTFEAEPGATLLDAARTAGLVLEHSCRTGRCGSCKAQVTAGQTRALIGEPGLAPEERAAGWVLTCAREAASPELGLDLEDLGPLAGIAVQTLPSRIDAIERLAPDVISVRLRLPPTAKFSYLAGQYVDVRSPSGPLRSYSLANAPAPDGKLELQVRRVPGGLFSEHWFERAAVGDMVRFEGPRGSMFLRDVAGLDLVMLATGTGLAPIKALLETLATRPAAEQPRRVTLYWGNRVPHDLYWQPGASLTALPDFDFVPVLSRAGADWPGVRGHVQDVALPRHDWAGAAVYACGANAMIAAARALLLRHGLPARRFHSDAFVASGVAANLGETTT